MDTKLEDHNLSVTPNCISERLHPKSSFDEDKSSATRPTQQFLSSQQNLSPAP